VVAPFALARPDLAWPLARRLDPLVLSLYWIQLRTRVLDEALVAYAEAGGDQVVLLGAGYDSRALRFQARFPGVRFYEVDHPASQQAKRERFRELGLPHGNAWFVPADLQSEPVECLVGRLSGSGLHSSRPTLTIWEGVTMYLTEDALARTVTAIRAYGGAGSSLLFDYYRKQSLGRRSLGERVLGALAIEGDEPFRFGWDPEALPGWLRERGFRLDTDRTETSLADRFLDPTARAEFLGSLGEWRLHLAEAGAV
jgi:methyltransferase (TIGR00027 family)